MLHNEFDASTRLKNLQWNDGNGWMGSSLRFRDRFKSRQGPFGLRQEQDYIYTLYLHTHPTFVISYTWSLSIKRVITK